jgi:hypothetical protein
MSNSTEEVLAPNTNNFIKSIRDIGNPFEIAVTDLIDNSISAKATSINIYSIENNLRLANNIADDLTIKKITHDNPEMKAQFDELTDRAK